MQNENWMSYKLESRLLGEITATSDMQPLTVWITTNCRHSLDHRESKGIPEKTSTSVSLTTLKPLAVWIITNCGKFLNRWEFQAPDLPPEKSRSTS